jgi:hypothetical protein
MKSKLPCVLTSLALLAPSPALAGAPDQNHGLRGTANADVGLYTAFCPRGAPRARRDSRHEGSEPNAPSEFEPLGSEDEEETIEAEANPASEPASPRSERPLAAAASTSEAGWPAKECLKMDKGPAGRSHTLVGLNGVHNWLLGGYGNDTIIGGDRGDVIWADYHPSGEPRTQTAVIRAGNGRNVIYANDTHTEVWTGTNPRTVVHAHVSGISGVIHCQSPRIVVFLSIVSERHFTLDGCRHISHFSVGY